MKFQPQFLVALACLCVLGCGEGESDDGTAGRMVFVDTQTMAAMVQPVSDTFPSVNPLTGQPTLMPGLYCSSCRKWYPVPPPDQINRRPDGALCPKTRTLLIADGPWPDDATGSTGEGS